MKLLPQQIIKNGISNYTFGVNTPNYDTSLLTNGNLQQQMKAAGVSVIRTPVCPPNGGTYSDGELDQLATAISKSGAVMLAILPHGQTAFSQHVVSYLGSRCNLYEYSNEPDINNISWQSYLSQWNALIPLLRAINPGAAYIGPVLGVFSNVDNYLMPWLQGCKASGVLPDAISFHIYPCTGGSISQSVCISRAAGIGASAAQLRTKIHNVLGYDLPLALTEWNADAFYNNSPHSGNNSGQGYNSNASSNDTFNHQFVVDAIEGFIANNIDMACLFELSYFLANKNGPISTTAQYTAMASEYQKYFSGVAPTPTPTPVPVPTPEPAITTTPTTFYLANATSATLSSASQLYTKPGTPPTTWHYSRVGTALGYGELGSQGSTSAWPALAAIGAPTGKGSFYDVSLAGQQTIAGNWTANIRLNCAQNGDQFPQAGNLSADIIKRAFHYSPATKTYTPIASMMLTTASLTPAYTTYPLPASSGIVVSFELGDLLYVDKWVNVLSNTNNNPLQDIRENRFSIDIANKTGDNNTVITCPGFIPTARTQTIIVQTTLTNVGLDLLRDDLIQVEPLLSYIALGSGNTEPTADDTKLQSEVRRTTIFTTTKGSKHGELLISITLDVTDTNIQEIGIFGGNASSTPNSGVLLAHGVLSAGIAGPSTLQLDIVI